MGAIPFTVKVLGRDRRERETRTDPNAIRGLPKHLFVEVPKEEETISNLAED